VTSMLYNLPTLTAEMTYSFKSVVLAMFNLEFLLEKRHDDC
jgi:hypothetical protein